MFITFKFRIKDSAAKNCLIRYAEACNQVWNFCVATQREWERRCRAGKSNRWPTAFDLINLTSGSCTELELNSDTVQAICRQFAVSRDAKRRSPRFRASFGSKRSLGWVPVTFKSVRIDGDSIVYRRRRFRFWHSRAIEGEFRSGAFVQDARGRWYVTLQCKVLPTEGVADGEIGIDLGLSSLATCSDGTIIPALRNYRALEAALGRAQRANNKRRAKAIHAKIANTRRHHLHVASTSLVRKNSLIVVGNVNAAQLAKTRMAKSVLDAGWSTFRNMLRYKAARRQAVYVEADERWTTRTCSDCGAISGPKGLAGLGVRKWVCAECGSEHDRDLNAARLILLSGRNVGLRTRKSETFSETLTVFPLLDSSENLAS